MKKVTITIAAVILVMVMIFPGRIAYASLDDNINNHLKYSWITSKPIAHRGLFNNICPENSLAAFSNAVKNGYAMELDVYLTKDKKVVVVHDENLKRLTGENKDVQGITYNQLEKLNLQGTKERIPLLSDVLKEVNGREPIIIEIKTNNDVIALSKAVYKELQGYKGNCAIQSFNTDVIKWYANNAPHIARGILIGCLSDKNNLDIYNKFIVNSNKKPNFISIDLSGVNDSRVQQLRKAGIIVLSWTIKNKAEAEKVNKYADNIIFDSFSP